MIFELHDPINNNRFPPVSVNSNPHFPKATDLTLDVMEWGMIEENGPVSTLSSKRWWSIGEDDVCRESGT